MITNLIKICLPLLICHSGGKSIARDKPRQLFSYESLRRESWYIAAFGAIFSEHDQEIETSIYY